MALVTNNVATVDFDQFFIISKEWVWTSVFLQTMYYDFDTMVAWLSSNCKSKVVFHAAGFAFEDAADAIVFTLYWA